MPVKISDFHGPSAPTVCWLDSLHDLIDPLKEHCMDEEEGVDTIIAKCLGSLSFVCIQK